MILFAIALQIVQPAVDTGTIIIYRPSTIVGAAVACPVRHKAREIVELGRGKFARWSVTPGRYILTNKTSSVEVAVDPGETRYVRCALKMGILSARADLQIVDEENFIKHSADYEEKLVNETPTNPSQTDPS